MGEKTLDDYFADWESSAFGFGYGSGEGHILPLLREFLSLCQGGSNGQYDFRQIEDKIGAPATWFLINALCRHSIDVIEYGTSPRFGWLTDNGMRLREYVLSKTGQELAENVCGRDENYSVCYPDACNCGPNGYESGRICANPFWPLRARGIA